MLSRAEQQIEEQQLRIEELQAELRLAEVRAKRVDRDTLTKLGGESTVGGVGATQFHPSVGGTADETPLAKETHAKPPGDEAAATVEMTASSIEPPLADTGAPKKEGRKPDAKEGDEPPDKAGTTSPRAELEWDQHMGSHSSKSFLVKISMVIHLNSLS